MTLKSTYFLFFFFNDTATTEIYTLSLHDALPIFFFQALTLKVRNAQKDLRSGISLVGSLSQPPGCRPGKCRCARSEEHTSELQSLRHLVCRLLLEKKKNN